MTADRLHSIGYTPALDGLRAVSVLLVVVAHPGLGRIARRLGRPAVPQANTAVTG